MSNDREHLDFVESALLELQQAEGAAVFAKTPVEVDAVVRTGVASVGYGTGSRRLRWLSAAAVLAFAMGLWGLIFSADHGPAPDGKRVADGVAGWRNDLSVCESGFLGCFSGPRVGVGSPADCQKADFDSDGDVDLADYGAYQLAYVDTHSRTH